jgi:hypothetical protein
MPQLPIQNLKKCILLWIAFIGNVVLALEEAIILFLEVPHKWLQKQEL